MLVSPPPSHCSCPCPGLDEASPREGYERGQEALQPQPQQQPVLAAAAAAGQGFSSTHGRAWSSLGGTFQSVEPRAEISEQASLEKIGAEEVWKMGTAFLSLAQGMPWVFVSGEGTG